MEFNFVMEYELYDALADYYFPMTHGLYNIVQSMGHGVLSSHGLWVVQCFSKLLFSHDPWVIQRFTLGANPYLPTRYVLSSLWVLNQNTQHGPTRSI